MLMKEATLYTQQRQDRVQCTACSHYCTIAEGKSGICNVRENREGKLYLTVFGEVVAQNIDPIEKKPLYHFLPTTPVFSIGTFGCNFKCDFCQNWAISQTTDDVHHRSASLTPERIVEYCIQNEIPSIAYTYNEPTIFIEFAHAIATCARTEGIKNIFVSNGFMSNEAIEYIAPVLDAINVDIKADSEEFYRKFCKGDMTPVWNTIKQMIQHEVWVEATSLLIPGRNDSEAQVRKMGEKLHSLSKDIPWHLSGFHPDYKALDVEHTSDEILKHAYTIAQDIGLNYVYTGNIDDSETQSTQCVHCGELLIERTGNFSSIAGLESGKCNNCQKTIPGVWE